MPIELASGDPLLDLFRDITHLFSHVAGVLCDNSDGIPRQVFVRDVKVRDGLVLTREKDNPHDPNAVKVMTHLGKQIGYLPREVAKFVADRDDKGWMFDCVVMKRDRRRNDTHSPPLYFLDILLLGASPETDEFHRKMYCGIFLQDDIRARYPNFPVRSLLPE